MKERPVNLREHEVREVLATGKIQIRRPVKPQPREAGFGKWCEVAPYCTGTTWPLAYYERRNGVWNSSKPLVSPFEIPGNIHPHGTRLWVRETFCPVIDEDLWDAIKYKADGAVIKPEGLSELTGYRFDAWCEMEPKRWYGCCSMPRYASRIVLEVVSVRAERVSDVWEWVTDAERIEP